MEKQDLVILSPAKAFDDIVNGGLKEGEMGLVTAKKGLGKTSVLVQFGIDSLLKDKHLVHVSFDQHSSNVIAWYDSILAEIARKKHVDLTEISDDIVRERTILNFNQENFTLPKVVNTIKALKDSGINIASIVIDGLDLGNTSKEDLDTIAEYVKAEKMTAWFSYTNIAATLKETLEKNKLEDFSIVTHLASNGKELAMTILKGESEADASLTLDSKTQLMKK